LEPAIQQSVFQRRPFKQRRERNADSSRTKTMITNMHRLVLAATLGCSFAAFQGAEAQQVPQTVVALTGVELRQNESVDKNGVTATKAPARISITTKTLLEELAKDETLNGTWIAGFDNKVPANARLKVMYASPGDFSTITFEVVSGANTVGVANILSAAPADTNFLTTSGYVDANGGAQPPYYTIILRRYTLSYDARPMGDTLHFTVTGEGTTVSGGTKPNGKGIYSEEEAFGFGRGTGGGVDSTGTPFILTGVSIAATGKESLTDPNAVAAPAASSGTSIDAAESAGILWGESPAWALLGGSLTNGSGQIPPFLGVPTFSLH
jgi:hypothetical protein